MALLPVFSMADDAPRQKPLTQTEQLARVGDLLEAHVAIGREMRDLHVADRRHARDEQAHAEFLERQFEPPGNRQLDDRSWAHVVFQAMPEILGFFDGVVPAEYWALEEHAHPNYGWAHKTAVVSCPCGESPACNLGMPLTCACDRVFLFDGQTVKVHKVDDAANADAPRRLGPDDDAEPPGE